MKDIVNAIWPGYHISVKCKFLIERNIENINGKD